MFESVIGPKLPVRDDTVVVWMANGVPARFVFERARWRIEGSPRPIIEVPESHAHPLITHAPERLTGWRCTARRDGGAEVAELALRRAGSRWIAERL
ncbi:hypothetical protein [Leucobacter musarum]|uniref:hypothetical protein n=1 Tax=Leucobacter musarum TaxID=1930747 RepID=UPI0006A7F106|nr:hypothetical protein [Leucobacter musarum]